MIARRLPRRRRVDAAARLRRSAEFVNHAGPRARRRYRVTDAREDRPQMFNVRCGIAGVVAFVLIAFGLWQATDYSGSEPGPSAAPTSSPKAAIAPRLEAGSPNDAYEGDGNDGVVRCSWSEEGELTDIFSITSRGTKWVRRLDGLEGTRSGLALAPCVGGFSRRARERLWHTKCLAGCVS
jgi:hypothetical protein